MTLLPEPWSAITQPMNCAWFAFHSTAANTWSVWLWSLLSKIFGALCQKSNLCIAPLLVLANFDCVAAFSPSRVVNKNGIQEDSTVVFTPYSSSFLSANVSISIAAITASLLKKNLFISICNYASFVTIMCWWTVTHVLCATSYLMTARTQWHCSKLHEVKNSVRSILVACGGPHGYNASHPEEHYKAHPKHLGWHLHKNVNIIDQQQCGGRIADTLIIETLQPCLV